MRPAIFSSAVLALTLLSCASYMPLQFRPGDVRTLKVENPDVSIYLEPMGFKYGHYVFDLEVINHTPYPIQVDPQQISITTSSKEIPQPSDVGIENSTLSGKQFFAQSPETMYGIYHQKEKQLAVLSVLIAVINVGLLLYDGSSTRVSSKVSFHDKDITRAIIHDGVLLASQVATNVSKESHLKAQDEKYRLPSQIFTGGAIGGISNKRGKVFIPMESCQRYIRLMVPIGLQQYTFDFRR